MAFLCLRNNQIIQLPTLFTRKFCPPSASRNFPQRTFHAPTPPCRSVFYTPKPFLYFETGTITQCAVTNEIQFFRESENGFDENCFSDADQPYGPPLAILLPTSGLNEGLLKELIQFYGEKGFDVVTVHLSCEQLLFPCRAGGAMNVVTDLLEYLNETHKHRPYVFHGFSVGVYAFGEILAQFSDHYETYQTVSDNVKGCLWDSPVDIFAVKKLIGKHFYPRSWLKRWQLNGRVKRHFKDHPHDSVDYWFRSWQNFCNPIIKVPNIFFVSRNDVISNPVTLQTVHNKLEYNGIPIFQKIWWDSVHSHHFEHYWYEYLYGMLLFFNLSNLCPDECGKYRGCYEAACFTKIKPDGKAKSSFCLQ